MNMVAIVTGASRGIGKGITQSLKLRGVTVVGLSKANVADAADLWIQCDVRDPDQVESAVQKSVDMYGSIDVLVNSAGCVQYETLTETSLSLWNETIDTNLTGTFLMMRRVIPLMIDRRWGRIVNIASVAAKRGEPLMAAYAASKHGVLGLTRSAALQVAQYGVTVNAVCPGAIDTDLVNGALKKWSEKYGRSVELGRRVARSASPQNRFMEVAEVAGLVDFLVSDSAHGINGQAINICGGTLSC